MKKYAMFVALALSSFATHAADDMVNFWISDDKSTMIADVKVGVPTPISHSVNELSASCDFRSESTGIKHSLSLEAAHGLNAVILPLESSDAGVKAFIKIDKNSAPGQKLAVINKDCKLPTGKTTSVGVSMVDTFKWAEPTKIELPDGSIVLIKANKKSR